MADVAAAPVTTAPAAPAVADAPAVVGSPVAPEAAETRATPTNAREAVQMAKQRSRGEVNPALEVNRRHEQPRAPDGKFASPNPEPAAAPEVAAPDAQPAADPVAASAPDATPQATDTPPDWVRIDLPADHPWRAQGLSELTVPPALERYVREAANMPVRRREMEAERTARLEAERKALVLEAQIKALATQRDQAFMNPEVAARYAELKDAWGQPEADRYLRGVQAEYEAQISESQQSAEAEWQQQQQYHQARDFARNVYEGLQAQNVAGWWLAENLQRELGAYGWKVQQGFAEPDPAAAMQHVIHAYTNDPRVKPHLDKARMAQAQAQAETIRKAIEAEAAAKQRRELEELARAGRTNPLGRIPAAANTGQQGLPVSVGPQSAREAREYARNRARGLA